MDQAPLYQPKRSLVAIMAIAATCSFSQAGDSGSMGSSYSSDSGAVGASSAIGTSAVRNGQQSGYYNAGMSDISRRAMARREERTQEAMGIYEKGRQLYRDGKYEESLQEFKRSLDVLPKAPATDSRRACIVDSVGKASVATAQQYVKVGRYDEARQLLMDSLKIQPNDKLAQRELDYMDDPIRTNPAKTPQYVKNVEEVNKLLHMGYGYYDLGEFDSAVGEFSKVLRIDKYNTAARRGMEAVDKRRSLYYSAAYSQTRGAMLREVSASWESPIPMEIPDSPEVADTHVMDNAYGATANLMKLKSIVLPVVDFEDTTVEDAIEFLRNRSQQHDTNPGPNGERGINFVINDAQAGTAAAPVAASLDVSLEEGTEEGAEAAAPAAPALPTAQEVKKKHIGSLKLRNVPMLEVLKFICQNAGLRYKVEDYAVAILPAGGNDSDLYSKTFNVPPDFISSLSATGGGDAGGGESADPFAETSGSGASSSLQPRKPVQTLLKQMGIEFPAGASANYLAGNSSLIVRNTMSMLDTIEQLIEQMKGKNRQVKILTKFVEVTQDNTDELSFDWVVTPFSVSGDRETFLGGGTSNGTNKHPGDFVSNPGNANGWPINNNSDVLNGLATGGIRSGSDAIAGNTLDNLIQSPNRAEGTVKRPAPGILSMTGIYDEGAFQMLMRGLSQKKGSDVLTAPSVMARPGEEAKIEVIREFLYPKEYDPPQLPTNVGSNDNGNYGYGGGGILDGVLGGTTGTRPTVNSFPVTPATPTVFDVKNVGVTLAVIANVGENDYVIDLEFKPEIIEFEGFVNYGSPIQSSGVGSDGKPVSITLTDNRIEQPIFSTRRVTTKLYIYDGHTVAIGGLITENVQTIEDKVPIFGDLPFVGRFFRGNSENHLKKNLMIFVTGQIIDATGQPVRGRSLTSGLETPASPETAMPVADAGLLPPKP
ncbi:MAG: Amuc_1098 family type IV pilus outer membrane protein [Akkermansia sp.]